MKTTSMTTYFAEVHQGWFRVMGKLGAMEFVELDFIASWPMASRLAQKRNLH